MFKNNDPCLENAFEDEMLFILMTRDETAPAVIMEWIKLNLDKQPLEKLKEAFDCAMEMKVNRGYFQSKAVRKKLNLPDND